jgi:hypothetical protein
MAQSPTDDLRAQVLADQTVPEPVRRALERGLPLEELRLDAYARWWHAGTRIEHPRIQQLFSRSVELTAGGTAVLSIGGFTYPIRLEDTPYFVLSAAIDDEAGEVWLTLNDQTRERLGPSGLRLEGEARLVALVHEGRHPARFLRRAFHDLVEHIEQADDSYVLRVGSRRLRLTA